MSSSETLGSEHADGGGPLRGLRVVELAGKGPGPFAGMLLADMGADVVRIERIVDAGRPSRDLVVRSRRSLAIDLKQHEGQEVARRLIGESDVLVEGFRPGVMERLGLGPVECLELNPRLIYARATGWGQEGPLASRAGHDINYIGLSGALSLIGRTKQAPTPPLNLVGDLGGGGCLLAFGVLCGLLARRANGGRGQVVDLSMVDGSALLLTMFFGEPHAEALSERGSNLLDSGAPFYDAYRTADDRWLAVGAIEPDFYANLLSGLNLQTAMFHPQMDRSEWPNRKLVIAQRISERSLEDWIAVFAEVDACVSPVLTLEEASAHPHNVLRRTFVEAAGRTQPAPAPRFSIDKVSLPTPPPLVGADTEEVLRKLGYSAVQRADLHSRAVVAGGNLGPMSPRRNIP